MKMGGWSVVQDDFKSPVWVSDDLCTPYRTLLASGSTGIQESLAWRS